MSLHNNYRITLSPFVSTVLTPQGTGSCSLLFIVMPKAWPVGNMTDNVPLAGEQRNTLSCDNLFMI